MEFESPKISIITPSYNQDEFLSECIESVLNQDYPNLEYIIIDGGSTDGSVNIIKKYEKHIDYWISEEDSGQSDAINKGFKLATGDIVAWINSDDFYYPGTFELIEKEYSSTPEASFYYGNGNRVDRKGVIKSLFYREGTPDFSLEALIYGLNYILQPVTFIRHAALIEVGYLDQKLHYGMDSDLWIRLASLCSPKKLMDVLAATREYGDTKTSTGSFERVEELRRIAEKYSSCPLTPGVLLYYLDTLNNYLNVDDHPFMYSFQNEVIKFWRVAAENLSSFNTGPDGIPMSQTGNNQFSKSSNKIHPVKSTISRIIKRYLS